MPCSPLLAGLLAASCAGASLPNETPQEFFESKVRPILSEKCYSCHGPQKQRSSLRLDSGEAVRKGGDGGPVIVPGDPAKSRLVDALRHDGELKMPPTGKLTDAEIDVLAV